MKSSIYEKALKATIAEFTCRLGMRSHKLARKVGSCWQFLGSRIGLAGPSRACTRIAFDLRTLTVRSDVIGDPCTLYNAERRVIESPLISAVVWRAKRNQPRNRLAMHFSRSHDAVIRVYDAAWNVIETHEHKGGFQGVVNGLAILPPFNGP